MPPVDKKKPKTKAQVEKTKFSRFYTAESLMEKLVLKVKEIVPFPFCFIDSSAGTNRFASLLNVPFQAFDLQPPLQTFGHVYVTDFLKLTTQEMENTPFTPPPPHHLHHHHHTIYTTSKMIGVNPPYGLKSILAKAFIQKGYDLGMEYCVWLVPGSCKTLLFQLYECLYEENIHHGEFRVEDEVFFHDVYFFIGKKRDIPEIHDPITTTLPKKKNFSISQKELNAKTQFIVRRVGVNACKQAFIRVSSTHWKMFFKGKWFPESEDFQGKEVAGSGFCKIIFEHSLPFSQLEALCEHVCGEEASLHLKSKIAARHPPSLAHSDLAELIHENLFLTPPPPSFTVEECEIKPEHVLIVRKLGVNAGKQAFVRVSETLWKMFFQGKWETPSEGFHGRIVNGRAFSKIAFSRNPPQNLEELCEKICALDVSHLVDFKHPPYLTHGDLFKIIETLLH